MRAKVIEFAQNKKGLLLELEPTKLVIIGQLLVKGRQMFPHLDSLDFTLEVAPEIYEVQEEIGIPDELAMALQTFYAMRQNLSQRLASVWENSSLVYSTVFAVP
ncbi:MAG: hypothetical protein KW806_00485 [Candidatus Yanofskybacteria bacterium]|nr:hypothetical protein [Candidatus Yanofskybacteria bacterium]